MIDTLDAEKTYIVGGISDLDNLLDYVEDLYSGRSVSGYTKLNFVNWAKFEAHTKTTGGRHMAFLVQLVHDGRVGDMKTRVRSTTEKEQDAQYILSTVHMARGRQWKRVKLANDFLYPGQRVDGTDKDNMQRSWSQLDANLLYVAASRAMEVLDISECSAALQCMKNYKADSISVAIPSQPSDPFPHAMV